jgi:hypothetical protein
MPEVTCCPECGKKLRVPDDLIGKKVRCPGCSLMFFAEIDAPADDEPEPEPARAAPPRSRAVTGRRADAPGRPPRDEEEEDDRPRGRSRSRPEEDEEEEDRPRGRIRSRDEDEDRVRSRRDEDDRPRGRRRDEEDEEEDDRGPRRREEDDRDARPRLSPAMRGWWWVHLGVALVLISSLVFLGLMGVTLVFNGITMLTGAAAFAGFGGGNVWSFGGGGVLAMLFGLLVLVGGGGGLLATLTGMGMCMFAPAGKNGNSTRTLAITAFSCTIATLLCVPLSMVVGFAAGALVIVLFVLIFVLSLVGGVCWLLFLRAVAVDLRDPGLAQTVVNYMIAIVVYVGVAFSLSMLFFLVRSLVFLMVVGVLQQLASAALFFWYVWILVQLRALLVRHLARA